MPIVRVGMPWFRKERPKATQETLLDLQSYDKTKIDFQLCLVGGTHCVRGRNISAMANPSNGYAPVKQTLPYDYYLSMDDDMGFRAGNIQRLIDANLDVIGAAYINREGDASEIVAMPVDGKIKENQFRIWDSGIKECRWTGGGCILIKKSVFEAMPYPWWRNNVSIVKDENGIEYSEIQTEDISFCSNARDAGFKIWVDLDNRIAHIPT